jgi:Caspase domain
MGMVRAAILAFWSCWLFSQPALAALVVGNSAYKSVSPLRNPANDAAAIPAMFKKAGFDFVDTKLNVSANEMRRALRDFGSKTSDADVAVIYADHGIELDGNNYLIPVEHVRSLAAVTFFSFRFQVLKPAQVAGFRLEIWIRPI